MSTDRNPAMTTAADRERMRQHVVERLPKAVREAVVTKGPGLYVLTAADLDELKQARDLIPVSVQFPALTHLRRVLDELIQRMERQDP